jgi:hypothetical protein
MNRPLTLQTDRTTGGWQGIAIEVQPLRAV